MLLKTEVIQRVSMGFFFLITDFLEQLTAVFPFFN